MKKIKYGYVMIANIIVPIGWLYLFSNGDLFGALIILSAFVLINSLAEKEDERINIILASINQLTFYILTIAIFIVAIYSREMMIEKIGFVLMMIIIAVCVFRAVMFWILDKKGGVLSAKAKNKTEGV